MRRMGLCCVLGELRQTETQEPKNRRAFVMQSFAFQTLRLVPLGTAKKAADLQTKSALPMTTSRFSPFHRVKLALRPPICKMKVSSLSSAKVKSAFSGQPLGSRGWPDKSLSRTRLTAKMVAMTAAPVKPLITTTILISLTFASARSNPCKTSGGRKAGSTPGQLR